MNQLTLPSMNPPLASGMLNNPGVHENDNYKVVVGYPPASREFPQPLLGYLVVNKQYDVVEYFNQMYPYAKNMADELDKVIKKGFDNEDDKPPTDVFSKFK